MKKTLLVKSSLCAGCGSALRPNDVFCGNCGRARAQQQSKFCTRCGSKLSGDSLFCTQCGAPVANEKPIWVPSPRKKLTRRQVILLSTVLGLLLVLVIAGVVLWQLSLSWVKELTLSHNQLEIMRFETAQLTCAIYPEAAADRPVSWSSSDESIATVDENGVITAVKEGVCTVTAKAQWETASAEVTVTKPNISMISIVDADTNLTVGETLQLKEIFIPGKYNFLKPEWRSDNEKIATVDENGIVTAVGPGSCRIYAELYGVRDFANIVVYDLEPEEKELVGRWDVVSAYSPENDKFYDVDHMPIFLQFHMDGTGTLYNDGSSMKFVWAFLEEKEEKLYSVLYEDGVRNVMSYNGEEVLLEINHYYWFFAFNNSN